MMICLIFSIILLFIIGFDEPVLVAVLSLVIIAFIICLLIFYKLTIIIDDTHLSFIMGIGLIRKRFPLSDIESCTPVKNSVLWGIGIHMFPSGWIYNVSGLTAIELSFKNRKSRIRIGTDRPDEIAEAIQGKITDAQAGSYYEKTGKQGIYLTVAFIAAVILIPVIIFVSGSKETEVTFSESAMTISGMYGMPVTYGDILKADTLQVLPAIKTRTNGYSAGSIFKGHFKLYDNSKVMLFIMEKIPPYILIQTKSTTIYLNSVSSAKTREYFKNIKEKILIIH